MSCDYMCRSEMSDEILYVCLSVVLWCASVTVSIWSIMQLCRKVGRLGYHRVPSEYTDDR